MKGLTKPKRKTGKDISKTQNASRGKRQRDANLVFTLSLISMKDLGAMTDTDKKELDDRFKCEGSYTAANIRHRILTGFDSGCDNEAELNKGCQTFKGNSKSEASGKDDERIKGRVKRAIDRLLADESIVYSPLTLKVGDYSEKTGKWSKPGFPRYLPNHQRPSGTMRTFTRNALLSQLLPEEFILSLYGVESELIHEDPVEQDSNDYLNTIYADTPYSRWINKIAYTQFNTLGFSPVYPELDQDHFDVLLQALFSETKIKLTYSAKNTKALQSYFFSPVGIVFYGTKCYLIGKKGGEKRTYMTILLVQRIQKLEQTKYPVSSKCRGFDLNGYLRSGFFEFTDNVYDFTRVNSPASLKRIELVLDCKNPTTFERISNIFCSAKSIPTSGISSGKYLLGFESTWTSEMEQFLLSEANLIEVVKPEPLRNAVAKRLKMAAGFYS